MTEPLPADPTAPTYPHVGVELTGGDGNVFAIIGTVFRALRRQIGADAATAHADAAMACGSYDDVLALTMNTVDVR